MKKNYFGTQNKTSKNDKILFKPPPKKKVAEKIKPSVSIGVSKKNKNTTSVASLIPGNYEKTKLTKNDFIKLFQTISDMKNKKIEDIKVLIDSFISKDNENSYESEILKYIEENYTYFEIKFIASKFIVSNISTFGLFFEKFGRNKDLLKEEMSITKFIKKFDTTSKSYVKDLKEFGEKNISHQNLFNEIAVGLNIDLIVALFNGYLNQGDNDFRNYYSKVFVRENKRQIADFEKEKQLNKEKSHQNFLERMQHSHEKKKQEEISEKYNSCKNVYKKMPWIPGNIITKICISRSNINEKENSDTYFEDFIIDSSKFFFKDDEWYEVSEKYFQFQCDDTIKKKQKDDILYFFDVNDELLIAFKIGFSNSNNDFIIQNESIYNSERSFFANLNTSLNDITVNQILDGVLTEEIFNIGKQLFLNAISKITSSSKYNSDVTSLFNSGYYSVREFAKSLGEVIIYFDLDDISDSIFKKRIQKEYYNRNVLFNLPVHEKLPEILCNEDNENYKSFILNYINSKLNNFVYRFGENIYIIKNSFTKEYKRKIFPNEDLKISIDYTSINKLCDATLNILPENLIVYTNKKQTKCFVIKDLIQSIKNNEFNDIIFAKHILRIYDFEQILNPKVISDKFPLVNMIVQDILNLDDSLNKYEIEVNLGILVSEKKKEEQNEEEEQNEDEDEEDENILKEGKELTVLNEDDEEGEEIEENEDDKDDDKDEEGEEEEVKEDDTDSEEENEVEEVESDVEDDKDDDDKDEEGEEEVEDDDTDNEEEDEVEENESDVEEDDTVTEVEENESDVEEDDTVTEEEEDESEVFEREKLKKMNKFNDYSGISETLDLNDEYSIERNYVKGNGDCFFRSLYLSIIYNNPKNFKLIPNELRPSRLICEKNNFKDVDEFSKKARKYISNNYNDILNNIIEMGSMMSDNDIYPNSEDALFGEAGKCYIKFRGSKNFKKNEIVTVKHNNEWKKGKILKMKKVDSDSEENDRIYKIQLEKTNEILKNVISINIMKKDSINNFFKCAKKQILRRSIYPTYGEIGLIMDLLKQNFEIHNIILPKLYNIKVKSTNEIETNVDIKDILDKHKNVKNSFDIGDNIFFRKGDFIKGIIVKDNKDDTYKIKTKEKTIKSVKLRNILNRNKESLSSYNVKDKILFRSPFYKGVIDSINYDSTSNQNLSETSKNKILNDIQRYEKNKNENKIQIYLLSDNTHYNFLSLEKDDLEMLELNKDGNFTDNLLNYLNKKDGEVSESDIEYDSTEDGGECACDSIEDEDGGGEEDGKRQIKYCEKCKKKIPYDQIYFKSKNFNKNKKRIETVYFCGMECFKDFETWIK